MHKGLWVNRWYKYALKDANGLMELEKDAPSGGGQARGPLWREFTG